MAATQTAGEFIGQGSPSAPPVLAPGQKVSGTKVKELYDKGAKATATEVRNFWINRSFMAGEQWITWSEQLRRPQTAAPDPDGRLRLTFDRLLPNSRTIMAKLLRRALVFEVQPTDSDDDSSAGARCGQAVLTHTHREQNWEGIREDLGWATWQGGTGALCLDWDTAAGQPLGTTDSGRNYGTGDIVVTMLAINEMVTQPGTRDIERAHWWIKAQALPPSVVQATYKLDKAPKADASAAMTPLQYKLLRSDRREAPVDLTLVLTYYERPTNLSGSVGQVAVVVDGKVVQRGGWPFPFKDRLNIVATRETRVLGSWTGDTILSKAISPQVALNHAWSSILEHSKKAGNARFMVPEGSIDTTDGLSDEPGEFTPYHAAPGIPAPGYASPASLPAYIEQLPSQLEREIDDILGVHDVSRGEAPSGVHAGVALQLLSAQDDTPVGRLAKEMAEAFGRFGTLVLQTYQANVKEKRTARLTASGQRPEMIRWSGKDLSGQTDVEVPLEAVQPRSRDASMQFAIQLKTQFPDLPLPVFATIADLPSIDDLLAGVDPDVARARRENHDLALGNSPEPQTWDNHGTHIQEHRRFCKTARWDSLPDALKHLIELHVQGHETMAGEEAGQQVAKGQVDPALAAAAQGGQPPGSMGGPPGLPMAPPMPPGMPGPPGAPQGPPQAQPQGLDQGGVAPDTAAPPA